LAITSPTSGGRSSFETVALYEAKIKISTSELCKITNNTRADVEYSFAVLSSVVYLVLCFPKVLTPLTHNFQSFRGELL
jgi:hypothetical protein